MIECETTPSWQADLGSALGMSERCGGLLVQAEDVFDRHLGRAAFCERAFEFSLSTPSSGAVHSLRYVVDARELPPEGVRRLLRLYLGRLGMDQRPSAPPTAALVAQAAVETDATLPGGIGVAHDFDGEVRALKTYWQIADNESLLESLLGEAEKKEYDRLRQAIAAVGEDWKTKFFGFDLRPGARDRFKLYYPQQSYDRPLRLETVALIAERLGCRLAPDELAAVAFFVMQGETLLHPTGYALGIGVGSRPSFKLEVVPRAHSGAVEAGLSRALALAEALGLKSRPLAEGFRAYAAANPLHRAPSVEVVCIDFGRSGGRGVTVYLRF